MPLTGASQLKQPVFVCPGHTQSVSRAVHLARINAAWPGCDQCEWRFDTEGLADATAAATEMIRDQRAIGIQRTEFGVRGQYINHLTRHSASRLIHVFCDTIARAGQSTDSLRGAKAGRPANAGRTANAVSRDRLRDEDSHPVLQTIPSMIVGYDMRQSSPDVFVGVVSAIREFGMPVIDIGRSTAASMAEALRSTTGASAAVLITGAGFGVSTTGFDVFDVHGDPVPVVWKDHGLRLRAVQTSKDGRLVAAEHHDTERGLDSSEPAGAARDSLAATLLPQKRSSAATNGPGTRMMLDLPDQWKTRVSLPRIARKSGSHQILDFELRYRQWLTQWYPKRSSATVVCRCDDPLTGERCKWLGDRIGMTVLVRERHDAGSIPAQALTVCVDEDDRCFQIIMRNGQQMAVAELAEFINRSSHHSMHHATAHADVASHRFWLTDTARPTSAGGLEHIRDGLVTLGLMLQLQ